MVTRAQLDKLSGRIEALAQSLGVSDEPPPPFPCPTIIMAFDELKHGNTMLEKRKIEAWRSWCERTGTLIEYEVVLNFDAEI